MRTGIVLMAALLTTWMAGGCASTRPEPAQTGYVHLYQSGKYAAAYEEASKAAASPKGGAEKLQASLVAGESAQALGRDADAERWLRPLVSESDPTLSGKAACALGLIAAGKKDHKAAAELLSTASEKLTLDEAARAAMYAGDSYRALGRGADAKRMYLSAREKVRYDDGLRAMIGDRLAGGAGTGGSTATAAGGYTVQLGAYSTREAAQQVAGKHAGARIVAVTTSGRTLYAVRVGKFKTRSEAEPTKRSLGSGAVVIAATGE